MWKTESVPLGVSRVGKISLGFQIWDEVSNQPVDLTGYTEINMDFAFSSGEEKSNRFTPSYVNFKNGEFDITIDGTSFDYIEGQKEIVSIAYQISVVDENSNIFVVADGPFLLYPGIK